MIIPGKGAVFSSGIAWLPEGVGAARPRGKQIGRPLRVRSSVGKPKSIVRPSGVGGVAKRLSVVGTAAEVAYVVLREAILSNILNPGTRLRADELAKELGVSKTPVREALRKLQAEDFVVVGAGNALIVKVLSEKQLLEIYYTREALEGMAARLAADNAGQLDLAQLRAVLRDVEAALDRSDRDSIRNYAGEFQLELFKAAHNDFLSELLQSLQEKIRNHRTSTITVPGRDEEVVGFCRDVLRAIEARDPDTAERLARSNRRRTLELHLKMMRNSTAGSSAADG